MLKTGAILNFLVAAGHLACLPWLYPVLSIYRIDGIMETLALRYGAAIPYLLTVAIAFIFAVFGLYGLSGAGIMPAAAARNRYLHHCHPLPAAGRRGRCGNGRDGLRSSCGQYGSLCCRRRRHALPAGRAA